jgi:4-hydroxybutyrate CoA-transferase
MTWVSDFRSKLITLELAAQRVQSGHRIWVSPGNTTPAPFLEALVKRGSELRNVEIVHMLTLGDAPYTQPQYEGIFRHRGLFLGANVRDAVAAGRADYTPIHLSEIEELFSSGALPIDIAVVQLSPPDRHGHMSFGPGVDCSLTAARCAQYVIAEVNRQMPRTFGDNALHVSEVGAIVETDRPLLEVHPETITSIHRRIAQNVASLIPDGATLQLGIGGIPDAVLSFLGSKNDLGIHSEMISDGVIPLIEDGVINGRVKTIHRGKAVLGFVLGSRRLFDFLNENVMFEYHPIRYTNDPFVIAQNARMIAINSAIEVDISGQVCADSIGSRAYSGFGGQVDFIRGAARSRGGKPIIALPSTAKNGTVSRIATTLTPGAGVVTSRADVHYVVTEHGIAYLHGKSLRERAAALIEIADPRFRDELSEFAERAHYLERILA